MRLDLTQKLSQTELKSEVSKYLTKIERSFDVETSVEEVIHRLRNEKIDRFIEYFYITDQDSLIGIITARDLLYTDPSKKIADIVDHEIIKINEHETLERALKLISSHQLLVLPIVDETNRLLGVLELFPQDANELYTSKKVHQKNLRKDIFQFIGFSLEQAKLTSSWMEFRYRMPWLLCNLVGGLICAVIGEFFETTLAQFVLLALFIPLVLTLSESVSIQSMTLSLRFLHLRKIQLSQVFRRMVTEWKASALLALASGLMLSLFYFAWSTQLLPIVAITLSMLIAMVGSASFGAIFPILLHQFKLDPKVAAGPVVLMIADVLTIAVYLSLSTLLLM